MENPGEAKQDVEFLTKDEATIARRRFKSLTERRGLTNPTWPKKLRWMRAQLSVFRTCLEADVKKARGGAEIDRQDRDLIDVASAAQGHLMFLRYTLRDHYEDLTVQEQIAISEKILKAAEKRERYVHALGLGGRGNAVGVFGDDEE